MASPPNARTAPADAPYRRRCRAVALALVLALPLLRVGEAAGRLLFLPSYYDSFWHALTGEAWLSEMWWLYTSTWLGWGVARLLLLWLIAVPVCLLLPKVRRRKTLCIAAAGLGLVVFEVATFRLEFQWGGRTQSEWVWCLRSRDPELRRRAAEGLSMHTFKFGLPPGAFPVLRQALHDDVVEVRRFAASFHARHRSPDAVPDLTGALGDGDAEVRRRAAEALAELGTSASAALPALEGLFRDGDPFVRVSAAEAYLRAGGELSVGLPVLEEAAAHESSDLRRRAGQALAKVGESRPQEVSPLLSTLLHDGDRSVRFYTTLAVYDMRSGAKGLIPALLANLRDGDRFVRGTAAWALGQTGSDEGRVIAGLTEVLENDPDPSVRRDAAYALGYIGSPKVRPALRRALDDPDGKVREATRSALEQVNGAGRTP